MWNILRKNQHSISPSPLSGWPMFSPKFWKGIRKKWVRGELKEFIPQIFYKGLTVFLVKKDCKIKYGFEDSNSNVDLSSAANQPINVKLCGTLVLLNHLNFVDCSEISPNVIVKYMQHVGIIWAYSA